MNDTHIDHVADLRHALANPLAGLLAEVQLALLSADRLDAASRQTLTDIERLALRMKDILHDSRVTSANPLPRSTAEEHS